MKRTANLRLLSAAIAILVIGATVPAFPVAAQQQEVADSFVSQKKATLHRGAKSTATGKQKSKKPPKGPKKDKGKKTWSSNSSASSALPSPTPFPTATTTPMPFPTNAAITGDERCKLQIVNDRLQECCGDWERQPNGELWYNVFKTCENYSFDFHKWCQEQGETCASVGASCKNADGSPDGAGHAINVIKLGDSWALVDPTAGAIVGTLPGDPSSSDSPEIPDVLACKVFGKTPDECGCKENGSCNCRANWTSAEPLLPNTDPALCATESLQYPEHQNLASCSACCSDVADDNIAFGAEFCKATMPSNPLGGQYATWLLMCANWYADVMRSRDLCNHACRAEYAGDQPCRPNCTDKECGSDGCGGSCGECEQGALCNAGRCPRPVNRTPVFEGTQTPQPPA